MTQQIKLPKLNEGEIYVGAIGDQHGNVYHLILLPGDNDDASWSEQLEWAKNIGGDLPNKIELAMLWNTCRGLFQKDVYWSNQEHEIDSSCAWNQYFGGGGQYTYTKGIGLRARAVKRVKIGG